MRIDILGLPASGKSTLAAAISKKLSIPHIHLDRFWLENGGRQGKHDTPNFEEVRAQVKAKALEAIKGNSWVSDGTYLHIQEEIAKRADVIIFLDIPLLVRLCNHAHRSFLESKRHAELSIWDEITFFREIIRRTFTSEPKLRRFIQEHKDKTIILRSRKEIRKYLKQL